MIKNQKLKKISISEARKKLEKTPGWFVKKSGICREFQFNDFKKAVKFSNQVAKTADKIKHHPNIFIHDYSHVWIESQTHKINGLTEKDIKLARAIESLKL